MITEDLIPKIEKAFGFPLYDWQKDYLLGEIDCMCGARNGKTFAYCLRILLSDKEPIHLREVLRYMDRENEERRSRWFKNYCLKISDILAENGIETAIMK